MSCRSIVVGLAFGSVLCLGGCGVDTNTNQIFKTSGEQNRIDSLLALGRIHYDRGEHDVALGYAQKAYDINPDSERSAILLSYVLLGKIGIDPFTMTKNLIGSTGTAETAKSALSFSLASSGSDALSGLSSLFSITSSDILDMGGFDDDALGDLAVFIPQKAEDPRASVPSLISISSAIKAICPFVSDDAKVDGYAPHSCEPADGTVAFRSKSNFLWALAHLGEALAFNSVLLYEGTPGTPALRLAETGSSTPNTGLFRRVESINSQTFELSNIALYVKSVQDLQTAITSVFDATEGGMLHAVLADFTAVAGGLGSIVGMPAGVTTKIKEGLESIQALADKLNPGEDAGLGGDAEALKIQMNKTISSKLQTSIEGFNSEYSDDKIKTLSPSEQTTVKENKADLCDAYKDISGIKGSNTGTLPTGC